MFTSLSNPPHPLRFGRAFAWLSWWHFRCSIVNVVCYPVIICVCIVVASFQLLVLRCFIFAQRGTLGLLFSLQIVLGSAAWLESCCVCSANGSVTFDLWPFLRNVSSLAPWICWNVPCDAVIS